MKKLLFLSLLAVSSVAYAQTTYQEVEHAALGHVDTPSIGMLTVDAEESCTISPECNALSPLGRVFCLAKGLGQGCMGAVWCAVSLGNYLYFSEAQMDMKSKCMYGLISLSALYVGADQFSRCVKNITTEVME